MLGEFHCHNPITNNWNESAIRVKGKEATSFYLLYGIEKLLYLMALIMSCGVPL